MRYEDGLRIKDILADEHAVGCFVTKNKSESLIGDGVIYDVIKGADDCEFLGLINNINSNIRISGVCVIDFNDNNVILRHDYSNSVDLFSHSLSGCEELDYEGLLKACSILANRINRNTLSESSVGALNSYRKGILAKNVFIVVLNFFKERKLILDNTEKI